MQSSKQTKVKNLDQFKLMFKAGGGEFHLFDESTLVQFNIKFDPHHKDRSWSYLNLAFTKQPFQRINYITIGRYNFKTLQAQIKSDLGMSPLGLRRLLKVFYDVLGVVNDNKSMSEFVTIYYSNVCAHCGRVLTDPTSIAKGFGPECEDYIEQLKSIQLPIFKS